MTKMAVDIFKYIYIGINFLGFLANKILFINIQRYSLCADVHIVINVTLFAALDVNVLSYLYAWASYLHTQQCFTSRVHLMME